MIAGEKHQLLLGIDVVHNRTEKLLQRLEHLYGKIHIPGMTHDIGNEMLVQRELMFRCDARQIRAVPTTAEVKVDRALELFNASDHPRTIAGIARTLGAPWVHASPDTTAPSEVTIVVAWELAWYRYRVDLGDADEPILLLEKGDELSELEEPLREWNALADDDGRLAAR